MPSCKDRYQWCKDEFENGKKAVYIGETGMAYCVFHAPKGRKGVSLQDFNKRIFDRINRTISGKQFCDLSGTVFEGGISFSSYNRDNPFLQISFLNVEFSGEAYFSDTVFSGAADFFKAIFGRDARFNRAQFNGDTSFALATFSKKAHFDRATFNQKVLFDSAMFNEGVSFAGRTFESGAEFNRFDAKEGVRFDEVNLKEVSFLDSDLRHVDFINCEWQKIGDREVLYDEILFFSKEGKGIWQKTKDPKQRKIGEIKNIEILYRRLKQKYIDEHDWPQVSNWHYGEKEMGRKQNTWIQFCRYENIFTRAYLPKFFNKLVYDLYWLLSGYAEKPFKAGIVLGIFIVTASVLAKLTGFISSQNPPVFTMTCVSEPLAYLLNTLQYIAFYKEPIFRPVSLSGEYVALFTRIVISIQVALFVLAIRNRFRK